MKVKGCAYCQGVDLTQKKMKIEDLDLNLQFEHFLRRRYRYYKVDAFKEAFGNVQSLTRSLS